MSSAAILPPFGFRISDFLRISVFGFRISPSSLVKFVQFVSTFAALAFPRLQPIMAPMGKRLEIAIAVLAVALVGVIGWQVAQPTQPEPLYEGKTLSAWLKASEKQKSGDDPFSQAVRQTGTNAIPTLLLWLRAKDSVLKAKLMDLAQRQHLVEIEYQGALKWNAAAKHAFRALGTNAESAVPALAGIVNENISPDSRTFALMSLANIGPSAIPTLVTAYATNADTELQHAVMEVLDGIDPVGAWRWKTTKSETDLLHKESFEQSVSDLITNHQQFLYRPESADSCLDMMLATPRAVKIIEAVESLSPAERETTCRRIFAQGARNVAMFIAADLGMRSLLADQFRSIESPRGAVNTPSYNDFLLNILQLAASHDGELSLKVSKVVEEAIEAERGSTRMGSVIDAKYDLPRTHLVTVLDGEIDWFARVSAGIQHVEAPKILKTWQFVNWSRFGTVSRHGDLLVLKWKELVFANEPK